MADTLLSVTIKAIDKASPEFKKLAAAAKQAKRDIETISKGAGIGKIRKDTSEAAKAMGKLQAEAIKANKQFDRMRRRSAPISTNLNKATVSAESLAASISNSRGQLLATAAVATGLFLAIKKSVDAFFELELAIAEISTLIDSAAVSNDQLTNSVITLSNEFGVNAVSVAKATYQAISAGAEAGAEANELLRVALQTSIGGLTDVATAVDGLTTIINAFGLSMSDAGDVADIMFTVMKGGKTTIEEISQRIFQVAPLASAMGVSLLDVSAALQALTLQGVPTRVAMTQVRSAIAGLGRDNPQVKKAFRDLGFESFQAAIQIRSLGEIFEDLNDLTGGSAGELQKLTGSIEGVQGILGTTGEKAIFFAQAMDALDNRTGAATEAFEKVAATLQKEFEQSLTSIINVIRVFGKAAAPTLIVILDVIASLAESFREVLQVLSDLNLAAPIIGLVTLLTLATAAFTALVVAAGFALIAIRELTPVIQVMRFGFTSATVATNAQTAALTKFGVAAGGTGAKLIKFLGTVAKFSLLFVVGELLIQIALFIAKMGAEAAEAADEINKMEFALNRVINLDTGQISAKFSFSTGDIAKATEETAIRDLEFVKLQLKATTAGIKVQLKDLEDLFENLKLDFSLKSGSLTSQITDLDLGLLEDPADIERLFNAGRAFDLLKAKGGQLKDRLKEIKEQAEGSVDELPRPFEEMENAIKAAFDQAQKLSEVNFKALTTEIEDAADQEILGVERTGDPFAALAIQEKKFDDLRKAQEAFDKDELARAKAKEVALLQNILSQDVKTVEQERKLQDQVNKVQRATAQVEIEQTKRRGAAVAKQLAATRSLLQQNSDLLTEFADNARTTATTFVNAFRALDRTRREQRGESEASIAIGEQRQALADVKKLFAEAEEGGKGTADKIRGEFEGAISAFISANQKVAELGGRTFTSSANLRTVEKFAESFNSIGEDEATSKQDVLEKKEAELLAQIKKIQTNLTEKVKLAIPVTLAVDDQGLTNAQQFITKFVEDNLNLTPTIDLTEVREGFAGVGQEVDAVKEKVIEAFSGGVIPEGQTVVTTFQGQLVAVKQGADATKESIVALTPAFTSLFEAITNIDNPNFSSDIKDKLKEAFTSEELQTQFTRFMKGSLEEFEEELLRILKAINGTTIDVKVLSGGSDITDFGGLKGGGHVTGPGTSTSDSIVARLSNNEFVVQARAVQKYGVGLFNQLNSLSFNALPKFASGGLVQPRIPTPSTSSENSRDVVDLNFNIGGQSIQLQGRRDQVSALTRATRSLQSTLIGG